MLLHCAAALTHLTDEPNQCCTEKHTQELDQLFPYEVCEILPEEFQAVMLSQLDKHQKY